jgi:hypothetical protein
MMRIRDPGPGSEKNSDPGWEKNRIRVRDKHPGGLGFGRETNLLHQVFVSGHQSIAVPYKLKVRRLTSAASWPSGFPASSGSNSAGTSTTKKSTS